MEPTKHNAIKKALKHCIIDKHLSFYITITILNHYHDKWFKDDKGRDIENLSDIDLRLRTQIRCAIVYGQSMVESDADDEDKARVIGAMRGYLHNALDLIAINTKEAKNGASHL